MSLLNDEISELDTKSFDITSKFLEEEEWINAEHPIYLMYVKQFLKSGFKVKVEMTKLPGIFGGSWEATVMFKDILSTTDKKYHLLHTRNVRTIADYEWVMGGDVQTVLERLAKKRERMLVK